MRTQIKKSVLGIMLISMSISAIAINSNHKNELAIITNEVKSLLSDPNFEIEQSQSARILIRINAKNEIVVLSVDSENNELESFIKDRLNYKKLKLNSIYKHQNYIVPVKMALK